MMKHFASFLCIAFILSGANAASFWDGSAIMSGYGEFPGTGLYAGCNSFPKNTLIEVQNLENGNTVRVIVTQSVDNPGVFITLSPEAAAALGADIGQMFRVRATLPQNPVDPMRETAGSHETLDPDQNPSILAQAEIDRFAKTTPGESSVASEVERTNVPAVQPETAIPDAPSANQVKENSVVQEPVPDPVAKTVSEPEPKAIPEPVAVVAAGPEPGLKAVPLDAIAEYSELETIPSVAIRESGKSDWVLAEPEPFETELEALASVDDMPVTEEKNVYPDDLSEEDLAEFSLPPGMEGAPDLAAILPEDANGVTSGLSVAVAEVPPESAIPHVTPELKIPEPAKRVEIVTLEPTYEKPPEPGIIPESKEPETVKEKPEPITEIPEPVLAKPEPVKVVPEPVPAMPDPGKVKPEPVLAKPEPVKAKPEPVKVPEAKGALPLVLTAFEREKTYIQLGAFTTVESLNSAALKVTLGTTWYEGTSVNGKTVYRLFMIPQKRDESGVLLLRLKALGFKDAFVKKER